MSFYFPIQLAAVALNHFGYGDFGSNLPPAMLKGLQVGVSTFNPPWQVAATQLLAGFAGYIIFAQDSISLSLFVLAIVTALKVSLIYNPPS